jgi:hypothetical protein
MNPASKQHKSAETAETRSPRAPLQSGGASVPASPLPVRTSLPLALNHKPGAPIAQCWLVGDVLPTGEPNTFIVRARKPVFSTLTAEGVPTQWIDTKTVMKILSIPSRGTMHEVRNSKWCKQYLIWRRRTPGKKGSRCLYDGSSVFRLLEALKELGK